MFALYRKSNFWKFQFFVRVHDNFYINLNIVSILDWWMGGNNVMGGMWIVRTYPIIYVQTWENQR